jgi:hypothetical protein
MRHPNILASLTWVYFPRPILLCFHDWKRLQLMFVGLLSGHRAIEPSVNMKASALAELEKDWRWKLRLTY